MIEFESKINTDFKKECMVAFEKALDECACQHEANNQAFISNEWPENTAIHKINTEQPCKVQIQLNYYWEGDEKPTLICHPAVDFNKKT